MAPKAGKSATNLEAQTQRLRGLASVMGINLDDLDSDDKSHSASAHKSPKKAKKARANSNQTETTGYTSLKRRTYTICSPDVSSDALSSHPECSHAAPINNGSFNQSNHTADTNAQTASAYTTPTNDATAQAQSAPFNSLGQIVAEAVKPVIQVCEALFSGIIADSPHAIARQIINSCFPYDNLDLIITEQNLVSSNMGHTEHSAAAYIVGHVYNQYSEQCSNVLIKDMRIIEQADQTEYRISLEVVVAGMNLQTLRDGYEALQAATAQEREAIINGMSDRFSKLFQDPIKVLCFTVENGFLARFELQNIEPKTSQTL